MHITSNMRQKNSLNYIKTTYKSRLVLEFIPLMLVRLSKNCIAHFLTKLITFSLTRTDMCLELNKIIIRNKTMFKYTRTIRHLPFIITLQIN